MRLLQAQSLDNVAIPTRQIKALTPVWRLFPVLDFLC